MITTFVIFNNSSPAHTWQQEVVAGVSGTLVGIDVISHTPVGSSATFFINIGPAWQDDANDFTMTYTSTVMDGWDFIDVSAAGITLNAGDRFVWGTVGTDGGLGLYGNEGRYGPGESWLNGVAWPPVVVGAPLAFAFRTYMDTGAAGTPIPEPPSLLLVGVVVFGAIASRRRRRRTTP